MRQLGKGSDAKAFSIIMSLACENVLEAKDCDGEEDLLEARQEQIDALNVAQTYLDKQFGEGQVAGCGCGHGLAARLKRENAT